MWREPKTDWSPNDFFNLEDYQRIKENLEYLHGYAYHLFPTIEIAEMRVRASRLDLPRAYDFNRFENNLEVINSNTFGNEIGDTLEYSPNGITIDADEMNRIESACLLLYGQLHERGKNHNHLSFKLGFKYGGAVFGGTLEENTYIALAMKIHSALENMVYGRAKTASTYTWNQIASMSWQDAEKLTWGE